MILVTEMPKEGQFVELYEYDGKLWSIVFRWIGGRLQEYSEDYAPLYFGEPRGYDESVVRLGYIIQ